MSDQTYLSSRVDEESELYKRFEDFVEEKGHSNDSAAVRDLVRTGLDVHEDIHRSKWADLAEGAAVAAWMGIFAALFSVIWIGVASAIAPMWGPLMLLGVALGMTGVAMIVVAPRIGRFAARRAEQQRSHRTGVEA